MLKITFAQSTALALILSLPLVNQDAFASKRVTFDDISDVRTKKSKTDSTQPLMSVKTEGEQKITHHVMTLQEIQQSIHKFNSRNGRYNCLACSVSFLRWIQSQGQILEEASILKPKDYNISYTDDAGKLIDHTNAEKIPYYPIMHVIGDDGCKDILEIDSEDSLNQINLDKISLKNLEDKIESLSLKVDLGYQYGLLFLSHIDSEDKGHFLNFYRYKSDDGSILSYIVDVQLKKIWTIDDFLELYSKSYQDSAYIWWDRSASSLKNAVEVKQEITDPHINMIANNSAGSIPTGRDTVDALLLKTLKSSTATQSVKGIVFYELARLKFLGRTTLITDEQAVGYLLQAYNSSTSSQCIKDDSAYKLASLKVEGFGTHDIYHR